MARYWRPIGSLICGLSATTVVALTVDEMQQWAWAALVAAMVMLTTGLLGGSRHLVALSTVLVFAVLGWDILVSGRQLWARSLVVGCLWFLTLELGLESINVRHRPTPEAPVDRIRIDGLLSVIAAAGSMAAASTVVAVGAPARTLAVQLFGLSFVLVALSVARRHLAQTDRPSGRQ